MPVYSITRVCLKCRQDVPVDKAVRFARGHYAHFECYLRDEGTLAALKPWQVAEFPVQLIRKHGLLEEAFAMLNKGAVHPRFKKEVTS